MFGILVIFVLVGPPVGAVIFLVTVGLIGMGHQADLSGLAWVGLFAIIYGVPFGYLIGAAPAAAAGLLVGIRQAFFGRTPWWLAIAIGVLVGIGFQVATGQPVVPSDDSVGLREQGVVMAITCLCATLLCWGIVRHWYFAPTAKTTEPTT
jgi:hypothetical protein